MKNEKTTWIGNTKVITWSEDVNGKTDYWKKVNGISYSITEKEFNQIRNAFVVHESKL